MVNVNCNFLLNVVKLIIFSVSEFYRLPTTRYSMLLRDCNFINCGSVDEGKYRKSDDDFPAGGDDRVNFNISILRFIYTSVSRLVYHITETSIYDTPGYSMLRVFADI